MFRKLKSVRMKLALGFGVVLILVCALGLLSLHSLNRQRVIADQMYSSNLQSIHDIDTVSQVLGRAQARAVTVLNQRSVKSANEFSAYFDDARKQIDSRLGDYYPSKVSTPSEDAKAKKVIDDYHALVPLVGQFIALTQAGNFDQAVSEYYSNVQSPFESLLAELGGLANVQMKQANAAHDAASYEGQQASWIVWGLLGVVLLLTMVITWLLTRMITRPLGQTRSLVYAIGQGRLDNEIKNPYRDEFGEMLTGLTDMQSRLVRIVSQVRDSSESVSVGARQIAAGNDELSTRTQQQAASLEETAASMEEMTSTVKQNAENAMHADQLAKNVRSQAQEGGEVVARAVEAMEEINAASRKIGDIVGLIDDIAFQTNLLALNASVEAARAGEQGRGFAVVATEVRNLASRSANAAKDIKTLVQDSAAKVADGSTQVSRSGSTLETIVESVTKVSDLVAEMASAGKEQSTGIDQVNVAVTEMDSMTQKNASLVEESAAAGRALEEQAMALKEQVAFFQVAASTNFAAATPRVVHQSPSGRKAEHAKKPATAQAPAPSVDQNDEWATF